MQFHGVEKLGTFIRWTTNDPAVLAELHKSICRLVREVGVSGLVEIANSARGWRSKYGSVLEESGPGFERWLGWRPRRALLFPYQAKSSNTSRDFNDPVAKTLTEVNEEKT